MHCISSNIARIANREKANTSSTMTLVRHSRYPRPVVKKRNEIKILKKMIRQKSKKYSKTKMGEKINSSGFINIGS